MSILPPPLSSPSMSVSGRVILITGGTQGLGLEIARALKGLGAAGLALVSRTEAKGAAACAELQDDKCRVVFIQADLRDADSTAAVVPQAAEALRSVGPISGLVNCAGWTARGNLETTTPQLWDDMMAVNARAPFLLTQAVAKHMIDAQVRGAIVNISSVAAHGGAPFIMPYSVSKAALNCMTKNNAAELAPKGIRVNAINMGWTYTENEDKLRSEQSVDWLAMADGSVPLQRILRPHDLAAATCFLLADSAAMVTGTVMDLHPEYHLGVVSSKAVDGMPPGPGDRS